MKKILSIVALIIYLFSINTLVHASTMGFFSHNETSPSHCHTHQQSSTDKKQDISCCEFVFSNEYSDTQIQLEYTNYLPHKLPTFNYLEKDAYTPNIYTQNVTWSPWRNPDIKYQKFSDLFGSIVSLS